jgi:hypothetical protein
VKFLCIDCDTQMAFSERQQPGDGTFAAAFACPRCGRAIALLANPMETQLVSSLGVQIGGSVLDAPAEPMALTRSAVAARADAFHDARDVALERPRWSPDAADRLGRVPSFVRGMVKRIYTDYAVERGIVEITPGVMDRAREELGLEGL